MKSQPSNQRVPKPKRKTRAKELSIAAAPRRDCAGAISKEAKKWAPSERGQRSLPPELLSRFPLALQEINRKLFSQNFFWVTVL